MRSFKFRGKRLKTDDPQQRWIEGTLAAWNDMYGNDRTCIVSASGYHNDVDPATVGQFAGLYDCNGKEIYEGDIVERKEEKSDYYPAQPGICKEYPETRRWVETRWYVVTYNIVPRLNNLELLCNQRDADKLEVIGNIYDNKDLLEKV